MLLRETYQSRLPRAKLPPRERSQSNNTRETMQTKKTVPLKIDGFEQLGPFYFLKSPETYDQYLGKPIDVHVTHSAQELKEISNEYYQIFERFKVEET